MAAALYRRRSYMDGAVKYAAVGNGVYEYAGAELEILSAAADFPPEVEQVMQTKGVGLEMGCENLMGITLLLPAYFIKSGKLTAVMNGQTGRIAVSKDRKKKSCPWVIKPLAYTLFATGLLSMPYHFQPESTCLFGFVFAALFFSIMGGREAFPDPQGNTQNRGGEGEARGGRVKERGRT